MRVVYHSHYIDFFEAARTEALRAMGLPYRALEEEGVIMPVVDLAVRYKRPAYYDDLLEIRTIFTENQPATRVRIDYEVRRNGDDRVIVTGHVTICFVDAARGRPIPAPESVVAAFATALTHGPELTMPSA